MTLQSEVTLPKMIVELLILTPGRYVGATEIEDDEVPFEEKMAELSARPNEQFAESHKLEAAIKRNLEMLGYGE